MNGLFDPVWDNSDPYDIRNYHVSYGRSGLELTWEGENDELSVMR